MKDLIDMARLWDIENNENNPMATGSERNAYVELCNSLKILKDYKFEPYQPVPSPPNPDFVIRLKEWIKQFDANDQKYMLYLASKLIFITHNQITYSMEYLFQKKIKKIILEDIIKERNFESFSYKKAEEYLGEELKKTLFVGLTDSSRINDFTHLNKGDIDRKANIGIGLETLLYPIKMSKKYEGQTDSKKKLKLCMEFEKEVLLEDDLITGKDRLIILEDFSGTGLDIIENFKFIDSSSLPFKKVVFAPYMITYQAIEKLENWIVNHSNGRKYYITNGIVIPKESTCFEYEKSYLKTEWQGYTYLFNWGRILGEDNEKLTEFLKRDFGIDWLKTANFETIDSGRTIKVYNKIKSLSLGLTEEGTKVNLIIDDGRTDEYVVRMEKGNLNVYKYIDICDKIKQICKAVYNKKFEHDPSKYLYGFGNIKIAFVNYYNCPDNSLPIIWYNKSDTEWKPLFIRASRII